MEIFSYAFLLILAAYGLFKTEVNDWADFVMVVIYSAMAATSFLFLAVALKGLQ